MLNWNIKEKPALGLQGSGGGLGYLAGAAGGDPVYVDDVFSTFLYSGNSSTQSINNGIDNTEKSLVWLKSRTGAGINHTLFTTFDGSRPSIAVQSNNSSTITNQTNGFNSMNSNGFTLGNSSTHMSLNNSGATYASWNFKAQKGFFDTVTYTGNGTAGRTIAHNLGSVPGMIIIKNIDASQDWAVYHRSIANTHYLRLNKSAIAESTNNYWNSTTATSTHFTLGNHASVNNNTDDFIAYIFAHDDASFGTDGGESIIKCGTYTGTGSDDSIDIGFEPQFIILKSTTNTNPWLMFDDIRGVHTDENDKYFSANEATDEATTNSLFGIDFLSNGFRAYKGGSGWTNNSGQTYVYMAIRRPNKPPEVGTDVFAMDVGNGSSTTPTWDSGFPVDLAFYANEFSTRLTGSKYLQSYNTNAEASNGNLSWDSNAGWGKAFSGSVPSYMLRRAPSFMDVVTYTGNSGANTIYHNLSAVPELFFLKNRSGGSLRVEIVANHDAGNTTSSGSFSFAEYFNTGITDSYVSTTNVGTSVNANGGSYLLYLFATLPGISKIGTYSGNTGYAINVDCGFTNGARFIMIKRTNGTGDWYYWDTYRGIGSGNDSYRRFNIDGNEVTNTNYVNPLSTGFIVNASAPATLNVNGGTYLFLAIA